MKSRLFTIVAFYSILILLLLSTYVHAQTAQYGLAPMPHKRSTEKTTNAQSRLVAECDLRFIDTTFVPSDSSFFFYSGNHGGDLNHTLDYDTSISYNYDSAYTNSTLEIQSFDASNNIDTIAIWYWDPTNNIYNLSYRVINVYDNNNNQTASIEQDWNNTWENADSTGWTYNANNDWILRLIYNWDNVANAWVYHSKDTITYTSTNNKSSETFQFWNASAWKNYSQMSYTYDNNNKKLSYLYQEGDTVNNSWVNEGLNLYTYDAANNLLTDTSKSWVSGAWKNYALTTYSSFVNQMPQIEIYQNWNAADTNWNNSYRYLYTYNSYNQQTSETEQEWDSTWVSEVHDVQYRYYYEAYNLAVKQVTNAGGSAHIYPVPAQDVLHIDLVWDAPQPCTIAIYDVQGRMLKQWQVSVAAEYHSTIPVNDFAMGSYFINITGVKGQIVQKLVVGK